MSSSKLQRWGGLLAMFGVAIWVTAWTFTGFTEDGSAAVLGLSERGWRRVMDVGTILLMTSLIGFHSRARDRHGNLGLAGYFISLAGLGTILVGNVIEFWVGDWLYGRRRSGFVPTDHIGWAIFLIGFMILLGGLLIVGLANLKERLRGITETEARR